MKQYAFILGSHPKLSFAELQAVLTMEGAASTPILRESVAFVESANELNAEALMGRLGGTVKICEVIGPYEEDAVTEWLFEHINTETKFHFGFSVYATDPGVSLKKYIKTIHRLGLELKKVLREEDVSARFVSSREVQLSSVIVHKERLLKNGVEIVLLKGKNELLFARTLAVQPFQAFSKRDYGRPGRDFRSGMLPPKLARMMVNVSKPDADSVILDPFCGSGTILQEALLLGYRPVMGSDNSPKAVKDTERNLAWVGVAATKLIVHDAQTLVRDGVFPAASVDRIIFEGYLGPPTPYPERLPGVVKQLTVLYTETFAELSKLLRPGGSIVAALPFWQRDKNGTHLPIHACIKKTTLTMAEEPLFYRRPKAIVGREIIVLHKSA